MAPPETDAFISARQDAVLSAFGDAFDTSKPVALIDFPNHNNCGDNAIWLGERAVLRKLSVDVAHVDDQSSYSGCVTARRPDVGTVLIHGGGNFGDIWPAEQRFREQVLRDHPNTPVVQLPQTIQFDTSSSLERARSALASHPAFIVLTRDPDSLATARDELGLNAMLCPDSAFGLGRLRTDRSPAAPIVWMARSDREGVVPPPVGEPDVRVVDWLRGNPFDRTASRRASLTVRGRRLYEASQRFSALRATARPFRQRTFDALARRRLSRGIDILAFGEVVVTDRLHGHILSCLLGKPHVVIDTKHGKLMSYLDAFPPPPGLVHVATTTDEALAQARGLLEA